jgi:hypothetical protein
VANALAYFAATPERKKKMFNNFESRFVEMAAVSKRELLGPVLVYSR